MPSAEEKINVLMVTLSYQGLINPMLKFAKRLISKGVNVTFATNEEDHHSMLKKSNDDGTNSNNNSEIKLEFFSDGLSIDFDRSDRETLVNSLYEKGPENLSTLITNLTKVHNHNFSCVIINPFIPWAIDVAVDHGIPCALLWIQPCALYSIYYRYFKNTNEFPSFEDLNEKVNLPGLPTFKVRDLPSFLLPSSPLFFKELVGNLFKGLDKVKWVLGASFFEIEEEIVKSMDSLTPIYNVGPLVSPFLLGEKEVTNDVSMDMWKAEDSCIEWLDNKPPSSVIYISFGSQIVLSQNQINNIAKALKNINKPFLWVVKPASNKKDGVVKFPEEFLKETEGKGLVVKWCPQEKVLKHPSVACFISHCGWNSTLETVVTGVPVVAWPFWTDQPTNAMLIEKVFGNGVGVNFGEDRIVSAEEIERCIWDVMEGTNAEDIKKRVMEMKESAWKALQEGGTSSKNINQFLNDLIVNNSYGA